ncbi:MAG: hypothetical protein ACOYKA_06880 [Legionellaceae bacterium]
MAKTTESSLKDCINCCKNIDALDDHGRTALMIAQEYDNLDAMDTLIQHGAKIEEANDDSILSLTKN